MVIEYNTMYLCDVLLTIANLDIPNNNAAIKEKLHHLGVYCHSEGQPHVLIPLF